MGYRASSGVYREAWGGAYFKAHLHLSEQRTVSRCGVVKGCGYLCVSRV